MIPNLGKKEILSRIFNGLDKAKLHLYSVDIPLSLTDTISSYTEVGTAISLSSLWNISQNLATYSEVSFDFNNSILAYGYYVTNSSNTIVLFSERFGDGPYRTNVTGGSIKVTPSIQLD
jgi:hypothetical protein